MRKLLVAAVLLAASASTAAEWSSVEVGSGTVTWTETGTTDSGKIHVTTPTTCHNIGDNDVTFYVASPSGTKGSAWGGALPNGDTCLIGETTVCSSIALDPGYYVAAPESPDAGTANVYCQGSSSR